MTKSIFWFFSVLLVCTAAFAVTYVVPPDDILAAKAQAIVIGRALTSYSEESAKHGIETVTVLNIEEVVKGELAPGTEVKVRSVGGVVGRRARIIPGSPIFTNGQRVLVFLNDFDSGDYVVTDLGLGFFGFETDDGGREVVIRTATEIYGWNTDGTVHHEARRDAQKFIAFLRGISRQIPMNDGYTVEARPLIGENAKSSLERLRPVIQSYMVTQYTMASGAEATSAGFRWKVFPAQVNWNRGNSETGVADGGTVAINSAFAAWNGDASSNVNYALTSAIANTSGSQDPPDGVNNVVFEKTISGYAAFTCGSGGVLGLGGITNGTGDTANGDSTNTVNGEIFWTTSEGDVSMNVGVGACIGSTLSVGDFNSAVTHEIGHTLGLRHADKTRVGTLACTTQATYDCSSSAIMTAYITGGLSATLQAWDHRAVAAIYPAPTATYNPPTGVEAHGISMAAAQISWVAPAGGTAPGRYNVYRNGGAGYSFAGYTTPPTTTFVDTGVSTNKAYLYKVRSADAANTTESTDSNVDMATVIIYTHTTLSAGSSIIYAVDVNELKMAVDGVRSLYNIGAGFYNYLPAVAGTTVVHADDINQLRTNLDTAYFGLFGVHPSYTNTITAGSSIVRALDFTELRNVMY